jgi:glutamate dehydrogenase/leucine dehydrogenase
VDKEEAWSRKALIAAPAARSKTIDRNRVEGWNGVEIELDIANNPNTPDGLDALREKRIAHILGSIANVGGVSASGFEWAKAMVELGGPNVGWDPRGFENTWYQTLSTTATQLFRAAHRARQGDEALPIDRVINDVVTTRLVRNHRVLEHLGSDNES